MDHALHHVQEPSQEYDLDLTVTDGTWPQGITGHDFIIGTSQPALAPFVWSGTGLITRVDLAPNAHGRPHWRSRRVVTPDTALIHGLARGVEPAVFGSLLSGTSIALTNTAPHLFKDRLILTFDMQLGLRSGDADQPSGGYVSRSPLSHRAGRCIARAGGSLDPGLS